MEQNKIAAVDAIDSYNIPELELKEIPSLQPEESKEDDAGDKKGGKPVQELAEKGLKSVPYSNYFKPDIKLCLAVGNFDYSSVPGWSDLPYAK